VICFAPSLVDSFIFLTLTRLVVVIIFENFSFALFTPPLGDYQKPMGTDGHVDLNKGGKSVDQKAYRSMIGSLLYLCASRLDIMLSVCMSLQETG
jgi:hypothetical protein